MTKLKRIIDFLSWPIRNYAAKRRLKKISLRDPFIYK